MLDRLLSEIRRNVRLRAGVSLIIAIVWLYAVLVMQDAYKAKMSEYESLADRMVRLKSIETETAWPERAKEAVSLRTEMEDGLWKSGTLGLARAAFQDWVNQKLLESGVKRPAVSISENSETGGVPSDLWKIEAKVEFDFNPATFDRLMAALIGNKQKVYVERLRIAKEPIPRATLVLLSFCQKAKAAP